MEIKITGEAKEIAALVLAVQERKAGRTDIAEIIDAMAVELLRETQNQLYSDYDILRKAADNHFSTDFSQSKEGRDYGRE